MLKGEKGFETRMSGKPQTLPEKIYLNGKEASSLERSVIGALSVTDNLQDRSRKVTTYFRHGTDS